MRNIPKEEFLQPTVIHNYNGNDVTRTVSVQDVHSDLRWSDNYIWIRYYCCYSQRLRVLNLAVFINDYRNADDIAALNIKRLIYRFSSVIVSII